MIIEVQNESIRVTGLITAAATITLISGLAIAETTNPPDGPPLEVEAIESDGGLMIAPSFRPAEGEAQELPADMPPLNEIPPYPMPFPPEPGIEKAIDSGPSAPVMYDPETGETLEGEIILNPNPVLQEGYNPGGGVGELAPATFTTKTLISNVGDSPWRMNVKVAFRRGTDWFVCSGGMIDARTVQTAGHCIHGGGTTGDWNDETWVFPGWDGNGDITMSPDTYRLETHGAARGAILGSVTNWTASGDSDYDWGLIELDRSAGFLTGWFGMETGTTCPTATHHVASYPSQFCSGSLHNGQDMYYWFGTIDNCPSNQLTLFTTAGCLTALWGGESGSNMYRLDGTERLTRGIASTSNRTTIANYVNLLPTWSDTVFDFFLPTHGRGATFDLEALDMNVSPAILQAGGSPVTLFNHLAANGTNGALNTTFNYQVRLSSNDLISTGDTNISNQTYSWNHTGIGSVRVNMPLVSIPENTPAGNYWLGVTYDAVTDSNLVNNDSSYWDAVPITVTQETNPPSPSTMTFSVLPHELSTSQIAMTATTATDPSGGIQYYLDYTSSPTAGSGGNDSGWQTSPSFTDTGLGPNESYCYRAWARDTYSNQTTPSAIDCDYTLANQPVAGSFTNITMTSIQVNLGKDDNPAGTQYWIRNQDNSAWQTWSTSKTFVNSGLTCGTTYSYGAWSQNGDGTISGGEVNLGSVNTLPCPDTDNDGISDMSDNCTLVANTDQRDTNGDGYGNICDADLDNDGTVGFTDFNLFRAVFGTAIDPDADFDGDGGIGFGDFIILRTSFGSPPGPSCCAP